MGASFPPDRVQALLEHRDFLRALARRLVADEQRAEDLAQDTWLAALQHPPRSLGAGRAWLARVLRNFASRTARREGERADRERRAARPETAEASGHAERDFELQLEIAEALSGLREPYRTAIHLRFFRELGPTEIARTLDVPVDTVKTRLRRGLELLRERLDARHGGERRLWSLPLAALLRGEPPPVPAPPACPPPSGAAPAGASGALGTTAVLHGVLVMKPIAIALASLGVAAALYLGLRSSGDEPARGVVDAGAPAAAEPVPAPAGAAEVPAPERVPAPLPAAPAAAGPTAPAEVGAASAAAAPRALLRVVDENGRAVPDAEVRLGPAPGPAVARTDGAGRAALSLPRGAPGELPLLVAAAGYVPSRSTVAPRAAPAPGGGQEADLGTVVLVRGGRVGGRVLDADGEPVADAELFVTAPDQVLFASVAAKPLGTRPSFAAAARSDERGEFAVDGVRPGAARVWAEAPDGRFGFSPILDVAPGGRLEGLEIELEPAGAADEIAGVVLLPADLSPADVSIWCRRPGPSGDATRLVSPKPNGRFRVALDEAMPHDLWIDPPTAGLRGAVALGVEPGTLDLVLELEDAPTVAVEVLDPFAAAIDPFSMQLVKTDGTHAQVQSHVTVHARPGARLDLPNVRFTVAFRADGYDEVELGPFEPGAVPDPLRVVLTPLPRVAGRVTAAGEPVAGATVEVTVPADPRRRVVVDDLPVRMELIAAASARTDEDGAYSLTLRERGRYFVRARAEGWATREIGPIWIDPATGVEGLDLELSRGGAIEGRVLAPPGASPAGVVVAVSRGDRFARTQVTGAEGWYRFERLTPGPWQVARRETEITGPPTWGTTSSSPTEVVWEGDCFVREGETTRFDLDLGRDAAVILKGRLAVDGAPLEGWTAELIEGAEGFFRGASASDRIPVDERGRFDLVAAEPGTYNLLLEGGELIEGGLGVLATVRLASGTNEWQLALATGRLVGRVAPGTLAPGAPLFALHVGARGELAGTALVLDADGAFEAVVPAGRLRLVSTTLPPTSSDPFAWPTLGEVDVPAGGTASLVVPE